MRIIKLETSSEDYGLVSHKDYVSTITSSLGGGRKGEQLVGKIMGLLTECVDVTVTKEKLTSDYKLTDEDMRLGIVRTNNYKVASFPTIVRRENLGVLKANKKGQNLRKRGSHTHQNWFACISH